MKTSLTKGLSQAQSIELRKDFEHSTILRRRMVELLREKIDSRRVESISKEDYTSPSWAYKQADSIGYERAMQEVISLLSSESV